MAERNFPPWIKKGYSRVAVYLFRREASEQLVVSLLLLARGIDGRREREEGEEGEEGGAQRLPSSSFLFSVLTSSSFPSPKIGAFFGRSGQAIFPFGRLDNLANA